MSTVRTFTIPAADGTALAVRAWIPERPKAVVQIAHGMAEHASRYEDTAQALNAAGYAVYANDHRGHGDTAGDPSRYGIFAPADGWAVVVRDLRTVNDHVTAEHPDLPIFLIGHSMGSVLARDYAIRYGRSIDGVVLTGTVAPLGAQGPVAALVAKLEARRRGRDAPSPLLDDMSFRSYNRAFRPARTEFDWLSRDESAVDAYVADPACGFICSAGMYGDVIAGIRRVYRPSLLRGIPRELPFLVCAGSKDPAAKDGRAVETVTKLLRAAGLHDVEGVVYPGARHELFNETNRRQVWADVIAWLDRHLPRPQEGRPVLVVGA